MLRYVLYILLSGVIFFSAMPGAWAEVTESEGFIFGKMDFAEAKETRAVVEISGHEIEFILERGRAMSTFTVGGYCRAVLGELGLRRHPGFGTNDCVDLTIDQEDWSGNQVDRIAVGQLVWVISARYNRPEDLLQVAAEGYARNIFGPDANLGLLRQALGIAGTREEQSAIWQGMDALTERVASSERQQADLAQRLVTAEQRIAAAADTVDDLVNELGGVIREDRLAELRDDLVNELAIDEDALAQRVSQLIQTNQVDSFADLRRVRAALEAEITARQELAAQVDELNDRYESLSARVEAGERERKELSEAVAAQVGRLDDFETVQAAQSQTVSLLGEEQERQARRLETLETRLQGLVAGEVSSSELAAEIVRNAFGEIEQRQSTFDPDLFRARVDTALAELNLTETMQFLVRAQLGEVTAEDGPLMQQVEAAIAATLEGADLVTKDDVANATEGLATEEFVRKEIAKNTPVDWLLRLFMLILSLCAIAMVYILYRLLKLGERDGAVSA